jgi:Kdo2-lipid IVA lauroyltransferase/acyltransferase
MSQFSEPAILPQGGAPQIELPTWRRLRYLAEYGAFRCVAGLARALPLELCADWSAWCWRRLGRFNSRQRRAAEQLARSLPELSDARQQAILVEMWDNLGRVFAETFHLDTFIADPTRYEMSREAELQQFIANHKDFVIVSLHSANWELAALGPLRAGLRIAGIYRHIKNPFVDAYVTRLRRPLYPAALLTKSRDTPRRFIKLMRGGATVAMMSDLREARGVDVPFFGRPAPSTSFPAWLAVQHDLPILAVRTLRLPRSHFRFDWTIIEPIRDGASREANVTQTTALVQSRFETWVRERPGEWMWVHRRWS